MVAPAAMLAVLLSIIGPVQLFNEPTVLATVNPWMGKDFTPMMLAYNAATGQTVPSGSGPPRPGHSARGAAVPGGVDDRAAVPDVHLDGARQHPWAVIIPSCVSPFGVFLGRIYVEASVPDELLEAARLDGASEIRVFFSIVLRLLAPAMVTIFLFIFVATWNNFLLPLMMVTSTELKPVTVGLYGMMSYFNPQYGAVLAVK